MDELEKLFEALKEQIMAANMHFDLYKKLHGSINEYYEPMNKSKNFWILTLNSHLEVTYASLCRIYDKHQKSNSIKNLLKKINVEYGSEIFPDIESDMEMISEKKIIISKLIKEYRNNYVAHISMKCILRNYQSMNGSLLSVSEINELIKNASDIINKYAQILFKKSYGFLAPFEYHDYKFILNAIHECHLKSKNHIQRLISGKPK